MFTTTYFEVHRNDGRVIAREASEHAAQGPASLPSGSASPVSTSR